MRGGKTLMGTVLIDQIMNFIFITNNICTMHVYTKNPLNDDSRSVFNNHY